MQASRTSPLWIATLFVLAYVDIFAYLRADVLKAALDGKVATTGFAVNQGVLICTWAYILIAALIVVLSLVLRPRINRAVNIVASLAYVLCKIGSAIGEDRLTTSSAAALKWCFQSLSSAPLGVAIS